MKLPAVLCAITTMAVASAAMATDWGDCANELDYLRRRSSDASDKAREAESKKSDFERKRDDLNRCVQNPQVYDLMGDRCQSARSYAESAQGYYRSSLDDLGNALGDVDRKVKAVAGACGVELKQVTGPAPQVPSGVKNPALCSVYLGYKGKLPLQQLIATCTPHMGEADCRACLQ